MLSVACPRCSHPLGIPDQFAGELFRCKRCGSSFQVTAPAAGVPTGEASFGPPMENPSAAAPSGHPAGPNALAPLSGRPDPNLVRFSCPRCRANFESPASQAGTKFHCSGCGQRIQVPTPPPNKTILGSLDTAPGPLAPQPLVPQPPAPQPLVVQPPAGRRDEMPVAEYDNAPRLPSIYINVNTSQPVQPVQPAPAPPPPRPRRRRYEEYPEEPPSGGAGMALGITSMVLGIIALPLAIFPCVGLLSLPLAGLAILLGLVGLAVGSGERQSSPGFAIAGLITGGVAIVLVLVWILAVPDFWGPRWRWR